MGQVLKVDHKPRFMSRSSLARVLDLSTTQLRRLEQTSPLFVPAAADMPVSSGNVRGRKMVRYHIEQVRTIERVLLGAIDLETGWLEWQIKRRELTNEEAS